MSILQHLTGQKYIAMIGDSKSATPINNWQYPLITLLEGHTHLNWGVGFNHATAGWTVSNAQSGLSAALAGASMTPDYLFVNIGINDTSGTPTSQATFEAAYASILDQLHAKWPSASVYAAHIWRSGGSFTTPVANMNSYIDNVQATRAWALDGIDERDWLSSWVDGGGIHPTIAGYFEMARQWRAVIGF